MSSWFSNFKKAQQDYLTYSPREFEDVTESPGTGITNEEDYIDYTIEPEEDGSFKVVEHGAYPKGSVLEGKPRDSVVGFFDTVQEAQDEYPQAEISRVGIN